MLTSRTQSPDSPSTQLQRTDTIKMDRLEAGKSVARVASNSNTVEGSNGDDVLSNADNVSQQIQTQSPTNSDHQTDKSEGSPARVSEADLSSGNPNGDDAAGRNGDRDTQENRGTSADLTYRLPPKVEDYKRSLELALQIGAVSTALIATVSATILQTYRSEDDWNSQNITGLIWAQDILSFASIIFNITTTLKASILVRKLGELGRRRTRVEQELVRRKRRSRLADSVVVWLPRVPEDIEG
ncbi:hypothetical protein PQX77_006513 [Marasmius sp. AFHP31]|nr:hypothetical protein PQX77_006513 [Marasmius sp. AFHP31]